MRETKARGVGSGRSAVAFLGCLMLLGVPGSTALAHGQVPNLSGVPVASPPQLAEARQAIREQHWQEAEALLRSELAAKGESAEPLYLLASTLFHEDKPKESLETYTRAAQYATPSGADLHTVALDYVLLGDYTDADRWITRASTESAGDGEIWYAMGRIKYTENRFPEALSSFQKALALMPRSPKVATNLGLTYEGLNRPEDAIAAYRQAIAWQAGAAHPSEQPLLDLGLLLTDRNELNEALSLLQEAEALAPQDSKVHTALGKLRARRQEYPEAQREFEQALAAEPNNAALHFQLGQVYRKEGNDARAKVELALAARLEGTHSSP